MLPIVTCTVNGKCVKVLDASVREYAQGAELFVHYGDRTTFGEAFNTALDTAFEQFEEVIVCNDDVVLTPDSYRLLLEDVKRLKAVHGEKLGFVGAHCDSAVPGQNIRFANGAEMDRFRCKWEWEKEAREVSMVSPIFAWLSRGAWKEAKFPPLNWYSDDVICQDLTAKGFRHFVSRSYVHHVGSQTVGHDDGKNNADAEGWLRANRPHLADQWLGPKTKRLKIAVYAIAKNEEAFVERFCLSARDADLVVIADTGSTDGTLRVARECGAQVHEIALSPWRFDRARDAVLALVPQDVDICVSLDLDEVLEPGWRQEIERLWVGGVTRLRYLYDWGQGLQFKYEKIHARQGYRWHHPCHEYPTPDLRTKEVWAETDRLLVRHLPDLTKSRGQYLDLLALSVKEDPLCPRNAFYYARELSFYSRWAESVAECKRYLALPTATWPNERSLAMRIIALCYKALGDSGLAEKWLFLAGAEASWTREPWVDLAQYYYEQGKWPDCLYMAEKALEIEHRELVYTSDMQAWGWKPHDLAAIAAWHTRQYRKALGHAQKALAFCPEDERLKGNLALIEKECENGKLA